MAMTNGQLAQLQDLSKCYMPRGARSWVMGKLEIAKWDAEDGTNTHLEEYQKAALRCLTHQYRNQIRAIKKNQERA